MNANNELFAKSYMVYAFIRGLNSVIEDDIKQRLGTNDVSFPSFRILWILFFEQNMTMSALTYIVQTNISNVYRQLSKLQNKDLIKIQSADDARIKEISLTEKGRKLVQEFINEKSGSPDFQTSSYINKIPERDMDIFIQVASSLSSKLIGQKFSNWVIKSADHIKTE